MEENVTAASEDLFSETVLPGEAEAAEIPPKKTKRRVNRQKLQDNIWGWAFCLPLIVGTIWFIYAALIMALLLSFTNYSIGAAGTDGTLGEFLAHLGDHIYKEAVVDAEGFPTGEYVTRPFFWYSQIFTKTVTDGGLGITMNEMGMYLFNTVFYMIGIPIGMILSMFLAVCMSRDIKGGNVFRVLYYIPCVASSISIVYTFKIMFDTTGVINGILGTDGLQWISGGESWNSLTGQTSSSAFMRNPYWCQGFISKCVIVIMSVWKGLGGTIILYVAGLSGVNAATKEAAQIDGANGWKVFWKVTMPDLYPTIFYNIVTSVIGGLQIYAEPVLLFGESSYTSGYVSLIWNYGLSTSGTKDTAYPSAGAAYGMFLAVIIFVLTLFQFWLDSRKKD
ncbi:MAG: carbohydrate ABC transporter permease [Candidatus Gallimonas sp.]